MFFIPPYPYGDDDDDGGDSGATPPAPVAKQSDAPLPLWLPQIESALARGAIRDPFEVACQIARGE